MAMSSNVTLRGLLGLGDAPAPLQDSALIMIDCQNTYTRGVMELDGVQAALDRGGQLLDRARAARHPDHPHPARRRPGLALRRRGRDRRDRRPGGPRAGEPVIVKNYPNSFVRTDLDARLERPAGSDLVLAGFMTHMCVNSTARGAFNLGYRPTVVAGATATRDAARPGGAAVPAAGVADGEPGRDRRPVRRGGRHARRPPRLTGPARGPGLREGRLAY